MVRLIVRILIRIQNFCQRRQFGPFRWLGRNIQRLLFIGRLIVPNHAIPWTQTERQRLLQFIRDRTIARKGRLYCAINIMASAALYHRSRHNIIRQNTDITLLSTSRQAVLRDLAIVADNINKLPEAAGITFDVVMTVDSGRKNSQLDAVFSAFLTAPVFRGVSVLWNKETAEAQLQRMATRSELPMIEKGTIFTCLGNPGNGDFSPIGYTPQTGLLMPGTGPRRNAIMYMKVAAPLQRVVAISLPETENGGLGKVLDEWGPILKDAKLSHPWVHFCLLNAGSEIPAQWEKTLFPMSVVGFDIADSIALAQTCHAYIGRFDLFGISALNHQRPGLYFSTGSGKTSRWQRDRESPIWRAEGNITVWASKRALNDVLVQIAPNH